MTVIDVLFLHLTLLFPLFFSMSYSQTIKRIICSIVVDIICIIRKRCPVDKRNTKRQFMLDREISE